MINAKMLKDITWGTAAALAAMAVGCGTSDLATSTDGGAVISTIAMDPPVILDNISAQCTEPHTVCMTVQMPSPLVMGPATHLAVAYYKQVPVMTPAEARGVLVQLPDLQAGQLFRIKSPDGNLMGSYYPVVLLYMQGGGDIIAVDNLDYTACDSSTSGRCEAAVLYSFTAQPINVTDTLKLVYGL